MEIETFAKEHHLRFTKDACGDPCVEGRIGESNISEYSATELAVAFVTDGKKPPRTGLFNTFKAAALDAGMTLRQLGDAEGIFTFDPLDDKQARVAIKGIRAKAKRQISPELAAAGAARLAAARQSRILAQIHT